VKPKDPPKRLPPSSSTDPAITYEPKRKFRWVLEVDGVDSFTLKKAQRPNLIHGEAPAGSLCLELYDPIEPSASKKIWRWWRERKSPKEISIRLLDPVGVVIEKWAFYNVTLEQADLGSLDYSLPDPCDITLYLKYEDVDLIK
jgi:hypothetical protein